MTVNELIAQLQVLSAQGYGELDVLKKHDITYEESSFPKLEKKLLASKSYGNVFQGDYVIL